MYTRTKELLITPPAIEPVTIAEAAVQCRIYNYAAGEDAEGLGDLITSARSYLEQVCWSVFITQTWQYWWDRYWWKMFLPRPPLQTVSWVKYVPPTGQPQPDPQTLLTLDTSIYELSAENQVPFLRLQYLRTWPITRGYRDDVTAQVVVGYGSKATDVPLPIRQAIKLLVSHLYFNRGDGPQEKLSPAIELLIQNYRFKEQ